MLVFSCASFERSAKQNAQSLSVASNNKRKKGYFQLRRAKSSYFVKQREKEGEAARARKSRIDCESIKAKSHRKCAK